MKTAPTNKENSPGTANSGSSKRHYTSRESSALSSRENVEKNRLLTPDNSVILKSPPNSPYGKSSNPTRLLDKSNEKPVKLTTNITPTKPTAAPKVQSPSYSLQKNTRNSTTTTPNSVLDDIPRIQYVEELDSSFEEEVNVDAR